MVAVAANSSRFPSLAFRSSTARRHRRHRGLGALVETVVGISILLVVSLVNAHGGPHRPPPAPPTHLATWNQRAVPIVISLVDDLRAIEGHTADPTRADPGSLASDDSRLRIDAGLAQRLQPSPDRTIQMAWTATLSSLWLAEHTLHAAASELDPAAVALAHQQFAATGDGLLRVGAELSAGG